MDESSAKVTLNLNSSLAGLSLLSGTNSFATYSLGAASFETLAVRRAKAAFTTPATTPPWKQAEGSGSLSSQVSAIQRMSSILASGPVSGRKLPDDVATAFTAYRALDRLRILADAAVAGPTDAVRERLQSTFASGLRELEGFVASAPGDKLSLAFDKSSTSARSVAIDKEGTVGTIMGRGVAEARDAPLTGLSGTEQFAVTIRRGAVSDVINVDLAGGPQPPTLDSISTSINDAIVAGSSWGVRFVPDKSTGSWGFKIENPGLEEVSIDQIAAPDALMVVTGMTDSEAPTSAQVMRITDPAGTAVRSTLTQIAGLDRLETERATLAASGQKTIEGVEPPSTDRFAATSAQAIVTAPDGSSYVVGTTAGDLDANRVSGSQDLFLTKLDSEGQVVWQRQLGASESASGAAVSLGPNGQIVVAGTVTGNFDGVDSDGDMLVARFDADGAELSSTLVRAVGSDAATSVAVADDGTIFVGGRSATGGGNAFIARIDAQGQLRERRRFDSGGSDTLTALAIGSSGELLALTKEGGSATLRRIDSTSLATDLGSIALGTADASVIAVAADGTIGVGGSTSGAVTGDQTNALAGGRDGFVAQISADLSTTRVTYLGTASSDRIDSLTFMNGNLYAGGRTTGDLGGTRQGTSDGFVARLDAGTGAIANIQQFGLSTRSAEPVRIAAAANGSTVLGALGLKRGRLDDQDSTLLTAQTSLRAGDQFSIKLNDGVARQITIAADETLASLSQKVSRITGTKATITTPSGEDGRTLSISAKPGNEIELIAGGEGRDALAKLGLPAARLVAPPAYDKDAPKVVPGGSYGLGLTNALDISTREGAAFALGRIKSAISMTQTAYRSLYWDDGKASIVNGGAGATGGASPRQLAQIARYQDALTRISSLTVGYNSGGFF
ncbi:NHL repeat-containing protein [Alteriqipengyuania sp. 357]